MGPRTRVPFDPACCSWPSELMWDLWSVQQHRWLSVVSASLVGGAGLQILSHVFSSFRKWLRWFSRAGPAEVEVSSACCGCHHSGVVVLGFFRLQDRLFPVCGCLGLLVQLWQNPSVTTHFVKSGWQLFDQLKEKGLVFSCRILEI